MPFENVKYFLEILQILLDYFLFAVLTLMYHSTRGKRLQTTKGIKSCTKCRCALSCVPGFEKSPVIVDRDNGFSYSGQVTFPIGRGGGRGGGGTPDFKWQGWSKDFFGFEIFNFGIFSGRKILASYFFGYLDLSEDFLGYSKLMFVFFVLYHFMLSGNFYGLEIQLRIFLVLNFGSGIFLGFVGSPRDFFG